MIAVGSSVSHLGIFHQLYKIKHLIFLVLTGKKNLHQKMLLAAPF